MNFYKTAVDLLWNEGQLESVRQGEGECSQSFSIPADLFLPLCLGHRTWQELRYIRPDMNPRMEKSALFIEALFPSRMSWIYEQY